MERAPGTPGILFTGASVADLADRAQLEEPITREIIDYSRHALHTSNFFGKLKNGEISLPCLKYVFSQYRYWRDQFHTWFGLCILKSGSCEPSYVRDAVLELADHTLTEMREDHAGLYRDFLRSLGVTPKELQQSVKNDCTTRYEQSFLLQFGTSTDNFVDSVAALSARELFAALRNTFVINALKEKYSVDQSPWWQLHERLEVEHFRGSVRPIIAEILAKHRSFNEAVSIMKSEIDCHVRYWDDLLAEYKI
jgi:thiaminase